ncbi:MAG: lytic transglycosylase domain-containing protein [Myxococcales bacterium]|nr:lytic transglycosylase domain-containing protein [Myxococcales bacterium]
MAQRSVVRFIALVAALAVLGYTAAWSVGALGPQGPRLPQPLADLAAALGVASVSLPDDWTLDKNPPEKAAELGLTAPLGEMAEPFASEAANAAWRTFREGRNAKALEQAEKVWLTLGEDSNADKAKADHERRIFAFLLAQLRWTEGKKSAAIAAARVAAGHPALGISALRWLVARADEAGLSHVVLALIGDRNEPSLRLARARALRRNGEFRSALAELGAVNAPKGTALLRRVQVERARALAASGQDDASVAVMRELLATGGKSNQAEELADWLLGSSDAVWQKRLEKRPQDAIAVLDALVFTAQRRRYPRAIPALKALSETASRDPAVACHALSWLAKCHDRKAEFDKSLAVLAGLKDRCDADAEVRKAVVALQVAEDPLGSGDIAFRTGRALAIQGKIEGGPWLKKAVDQGLNGQEASDAKLLLLVLSDPSAREVLEKQGPVAAQDYAERDMIDVAVWRVALQRLIDKKWQAALDLLDRLAAARDQGTAPAGETAQLETGFDDRDWAMGRAEYFAARALLELNRKDDALRRWRSVVQRHPLSYYAQMALAQLRKLGIDKLDSLTATPDAVATGPEITSTLLADVRIQRARKLGQLGWHDEAGEELDAAGLGRDSERTQKWQLGDPAQLWARAAMDDEAGRWTASHAVGRDALRAYTTAWPHDGNRAAWKLAYPRGYRALMDAAAKEFDLHPSIVYAICRAESGFNAKVESFAHAFGLLQLIVPTAKAMAKGLDIDATAETLKLPPVNVRLGAKFLKQLLTRFEREQQMAAGYNAGGGAVGRWRKQRGDWPMDLFVETIPFRETRDYAKRVSSTIAVYRNLYYGVPAFELALTQKALPAGDDPATEPSGQAAPFPIPAQVTPKVESDALESATAPTVAPTAVIAKPASKIAKVTRTHRGSKAMKAQSLGRAKLSVAAKNAVTLKVSAKVASSKAAKQGVSKSAKSQLSKTKVSADRPQGHAKAKVKGGKPVLVGKAEGKKRRR